MSKSLSLGKGKGSITHNNREFTPKNVEPNPVNLNVTYKQQSLDEAYRECFGAAVERYNAKQKRVDRKIAENDYYAHLFGSQSMKSTAKGGNNQFSFYEDVVQIGTMEDTGCGTADGIKARDALDKYMSGWQERNPQLHVFNAVLHLDEKTPHLHIDYIPVATGYKNGLDTQNGLNKAIEQMKDEAGKPKFKTVDKENTAFMQWRESERQALIAACREYGLEIGEKGKTRGYSLKPDHYKGEMRKAEAEIEKYQTMAEELKAEVVEVYQQREDVKSDITHLTARKDDLGQEVGNLTDEAEKARETAQNELKNAENTISLVKGYEAAAGDLNAFKSPKTHIIPEKINKKLVKQFEYPEQAQLVTIGQKTLNRLVERTKTVILKENEIEKREAAVDQREETLKNREIEVNEKDKLGDLKWKQAEQEENAFKAEKEKYQTLYSEQKELNGNYRKVLQFNKNAVAKIESLETENASLKEEVKTLKQRITDITAEFQDRLQKAWTSCKAMAQAIGFLKYDTGDYKAELSVKQGRLVDAVINYARSWADHDGFPEIAKEIDPKKIELSTGIKNHIADLEPKPEIKKKPKSYEIGG